MNRREKKYALKVALLVKEYRNAESFSDHLAACFKGNELKAQCARDVWNGKVSEEFYRELFRTKEANIDHHFLRILSEELD